LRRRLRKSSNSRLRYAIATTASRSRKIYPNLELGTDVGHAFYLGVETARAEIAYRLGKRYTQDEPLPFGVVAEVPGAAEDAHAMKFKEAGSTFAKPKTDKDGDKE
jgi:hypothetical protein